MNQSELKQRFSEQHPNQLAHVPRKRPEEILESCFKQYKTADPHWFAIWTLGTLASHGYKIVESS